MSLKKSSVRIVHKEGLCVCAPKIPAGTCMNQQTLTLTLAHGVYWLAINFALSVADALFVLRVLGVLKNLVHPPHLAQN